MVTDDRNLRPWRARQPRWLLLAVLVLTLRGESPPAVGQTPAAGEVSSGAARKMPAKRVRADREPSAIVLTQAPADRQPSGDVDGSAPGVLVVIEDAQPAATAAAEPGPAKAGDQLSAAGDANVKPPATDHDAPSVVAPQAAGSASRTYRPWALDEQAAAPAPGVDRAALLASARQHTDEAVRAGNQRNLALAREKFIAALQDLTLCHQSPSDRTATATPWSEVLIALDEADDFVSAASKLQPLTPRDIAAGHSSRAAATLPAQATPQEAAVYYGRFASQRLVAALPPSREASRALLGLGKVHALMVDQSSPVVRNGLTKAQFFYEAALRMDATNWRAANELGVLLARQKQFDEAAAFLRQSVAIEPRGDTLHNLAVALRGAGQEALASEADQRAADLGYGRAATPEQETTSPPAAPPTATPAATSTPTPAAEVQPTPVEATDASASSETDRQPLRASDDERSASKWKAAQIPGDEPAASTPASDAKSPKKTADQRGFFWWLKPNW